jgi:hypothetical protein
MRLLSVAILVALTAADAGAAVLSKGHRLLIEHGLQIQGMATKDDVFHLQTYKDANYTAINWLFDSDVSKHGDAPPGFPWTRWAADEAHVPPLAGSGEERFMSRLIAVSLGDEKNLNDEKVRDPYIDWFRKFQGRYPNTILYANNYGGQVNDAALADFVARAKPDMLAFDLYPWRSNYETKKPEPPPGGSPTAWYSELRRYREHARAANVPLATYRQSFHAEQDYDRTIYRDPSASEFRLNTFAALAFDVKFLIDFTYNTGASSFFTKPGGDSRPTSLYDELKRTNAEARNLGRALVHLRPIDDAKSPDRHTTSIVFIRGKHRDAAGKEQLNAIPIGFVPDPQSPDAAYTDWESDRNDPYLRGWTVERGSSLPGDVILSWFTPLDGSGEVYLMVVNGLCDLSATPPQTRQRITLNFVDGPATQSLQKLDRLKGNVVEMPLKVVNQRRQLVLDLNGGTGEVLKFNTGRSFIGAARATP